RIFQANTDKRDGCTTSSETLENTPFLSLDNVNLSIGMLEFWVANSSTYCLTSRDTFRSLRAACGTNPTISQIISL
ncbi:hypothetical protein PMAYCL1PPCAC_31617, partial [Pristionchus mayeri]